MRVRLAVHRPVDQLPVVDRAARGQARGTGAGRMTDPLGPLLELEGVAAAVKSAQDAVFAVHRLPANLRDGSATAAEASVRAARVSAAIDGADPEIPAEGAVTDPILTGSLRVAEALESLLPT